MRREIKEFKAFYFKLEINHDKKGLESLALFFKIFPKAKEVSVLGEMGVGSLSGQKQSLHPLILFTKTTRVTHTLPEFHNVNYSFQIIPIPLTQI